MIDRFAAVRFMLVLARPSAALVLIGLAIAGLAAYLIQVNPSGFDQTVAIALFFQMFAASTGFRWRLRRGHFDPALTGVARRSGIVLIHAAVSILPGAVLWCLLAGGGWLAAPSSLPTAATFTGLVTFAYVSVVVWTVSLAWSRYAGGACWIVVLFIAASTHRLAALRTDFLAGSADWLDMLRSARAALVCPLFLIADPRITSVRVILVVMAVTGMVLAGGIALAARFDGALTDES